ncbi:MAG: hypothetical protein CMJ81_07365 [Planctomycetaceae bacterium]|nr:hypothetical protein [Planctomycetaceae bacterium]MBP62126.1 hypothetical protein [Planctomycetaceae bacterium]
MIQNPKPTATGQTPLSNVNPNIRPLRTFIHSSSWKIWLLVFLAGFFGLEVALQFAAGRSTHSDSLLSQLENIPAATLSDAVDEVVGQRGFMSYDMRPVSSTQRMVGRAKTVLFGALDSVTNEKGNGPFHGVQVIDESGPGDIMVVVTGDLNVTGLGGLMATTAQVRGMSGVVVDGAVRDVDEIQALGLSVFCRSISPSTMLGRAASIGRDVPVLCGGVAVSSGDYIVGDRDGVVCIPADHVGAVLERALEMEAAEKKMIPKIHELKSLQKVVEMFKRI